VFVTIGVGFYGAVEVKRGLHAFGPTATGMVRFGHSILDQDLHKGSAFYKGRVHCEGLPYNGKEKPHTGAFLFLELVGIPANLDGSRIGDSDCPCERFIMARICELTDKGPIKGSHIWRSGKAKKKGGIGTHVTAITKRRFFPNLQRVKAIVNGEVRYMRVTAKAIKKGLVTKAPKRTWTKDQAAKAKA
jgi:large subunit ribosomal protein L28